MGEVGEGGGGWGVKRTRCSWVRSIDYVKVAEKCGSGSGWGDFGGGHKKRGRGASGDVWNCSPDRPLS